jgi:hypothetical protein
MFSLSDYLATSGEVDEYDVNVVDQILRLGNFNKLTQVVSKDKKRRGTGNDSPIEASSNSKKRKHTTLSCKIYIYFDELS